MYKQKRGKEEKRKSKKRKEEKHERRKCPWKDSNLCPPACKANFAKHCATAYVLIGANRWQQGATI